MSVLGRQGAPECKFDATCGDGLPPTRAQPMGVVGFIVGGAGLVGTITYLVVPDGRRARRRWMEKPFEPQHLAALVNERIQ